MNFDEHWARLADALENEGGCDIPETLINEAARQAALLDELREMLEKRPVKR